MTRALSARTKCRPSMRERRVDQEPYAVQLQRGIVKRVSLDVHLMRNCNIPCTEAKISQSTCVALCCVQATSRVYSQEVRRAHARLCFWIVQVDQSLRKYHSSLGSSSALREIRNKTARSASTSALLWLNRRLAELAQRVISLCEEDYLCSMHTAGEAVRRGGCICPS